jgi:phage terminase large subunit GpA-like protein
MTLPEWADTYRRLSTQSSNIGGPWRTSRVEVARGPMMAVTERGVRDITCMTCTQLLKTSLLENVIGYFSHLDPCPMLLTEPKEDSVRAFSKERLVPMAKASPVLTPLLGSDRATRRRFNLSISRVSRRLLGDGVRRLADEPCYARNPHHACRRS